jgi:hypothetical protein
MANGMVNEVVNKVWIRPVHSRHTANPFPGSVMGGVSAPRPITEPRGAENQSRMGKAHRRKVAQAKRRVFYGGDATSEYQIPGQITISRSLSYTVDYPPQETSL